MSVNRKVPTTTTDPSGVGGTSYSSQVAEEVEALWRLAGEPLTSIGGTVNAITASPLVSTSGYAAYEQGNRFSFIPGGDNTSTVTININGLGAKEIRDRTGTALAGGELVSGSLVTIEYDGTYFRIVSGATDSAATTGPTEQIFTSSGTWTRPAGCKRAEVFVQGAGGGGGGTGATDDAGNGGGGAGGTAIAILDVTTIASATITIGAGGAGATNGNGTAGGNSSWSDGTNTLTGNGGSGGVENEAGGAGGTATGGTLNITGGDGDGGGDGDSVTHGGKGGAGGASYFGGGGAGGFSDNSAQTGGDGNAPGSGGGGGNGDAGGGGTGANGIVRVVEYY